jgi:hypothetical protein
MKTDGFKTVFYQNGSPFFPLGGECHNSSSQSPESLECAFRVLKQMRANTAEIPVHWRQIEPKEGEFDFRQVDWAIEGARKNSFKLILLWFATWKNGKMQYAPDWVKTNPERFTRIIAHDGGSIAVLSSHCRANLEADKKAFAAVMEHVKKADTDGIVIGVQVENEPGIDGRAVRDHGIQGEADYQGKVPGVLMEKLPNIDPASPVRRAWERSGSRREGTWSDVFGPEGSEYVSVWSVARYIDEVAQAGKEKYNVPMFVNVWNGENGFLRPGLDYPSGCPVAKVVDIWKAVAPHIDIIAPDIHFSSMAQFDQSCANFKRSDNFLFVPESLRKKTNEWMVFRAIGKYKAVGFFFFGVEEMVLADGTYHPEFETVFASFNMVSDAIPLIMAYQDTMHCILEEEGMLFQIVETGDFVCNIQFKLPGNAYYNLRYPPARRNRGRGLLFQTGPREFYCVGDGFYFEIQQKHTLGSVDYAPAYNAIRNAAFRRIEEGHFEKDGTWKVDRIRSGDDEDYGVWMFAANRVVRVLLYD